MISKHLVHFNAVVIIWWPSLLLLGICYGPQGQGDVRYQLQPGRRAWGVQQHPPSIAATVSTPRWQGRSMSYNMIRGLRTLMEKSSWGSEEARGMSGTGLATSQLNCPPLPLYLKFEQGVRERGRPYDHDMISHSIWYKNSMLFLLY
jgi:hypothetical protein